MSPESLASGLPVPAVASSKDIVFPLACGTTVTADIVAPSASGEVVRVIGYCLTTDDQIWFNPDNTWVEVA